MCGYVGVLRTCAEGDGGPVSAPNGEGKVRNVRALLRVWLPWPRSRAQCQRWGLAPGPGWGALTEQKIPQSSSWNHRHQIIISPGREVEEEAQMCVCLTSVHSKTSGHLFVFVCVRVCTPVLVCALPLCVCACLCLCMYLGLCLSVCGCWSMPACMAVSGLCVAECICV